LLQQAWLLADDGICYGWYPNSGICSTLLPVSEEARGIDTLVYKSVLKAELNLYKNQNRERTATQYRNILPDFLSWEITYANRL
jgi:hypothetical protein